MLIFRAWATWIHSIACGSPLPMLSRNLIINTEDRLIKTPDVNLIKWVDEVFQGQYLPILGTNYVAINRDLENYHRSSEAATISLFWKWVSNFPFFWLANPQWLFQQANHGVYSNPGTQLMAQNKDFGAVLQTDLLEFSFVCGAGFHHSCEY